MRHAVYFATAAASFAIENPKPDPEPAPFTNGGAQAIQAMKLAPGISATVFAEEPMLGNSVCLSLDDRGRVFVAETWRYKSSVWDSRGRPPEVLEGDLACRTIEDRLALNFRVWGEQKAKQLGIETEIVRMLEDKDGDGKTDATSIFARDFNSIIEGTAGGVLAWGGDVYLACIPNLWRLGDDGRREKLLTGFGVHHNYTGHDFHGPVPGPDGRLYLSMGDRGAHVKTREGGVVAVPDEGAVFRCWPDGSEFEIVHRGLRNPHDLAFDDFGNLFTGDNDGDKGDEERIVHIIEGGDSGWRIGWQWPPLGNERDAWLTEAMHFRADYRQSQYNSEAAGKPYKRAKSEIIPEPGVQSAAYVRHVGGCGDGPSGLAFHPGVAALPPEWRGRFFLVHFKAVSPSSGITTFALEPDGASFRIREPRKFVENVPATDVTFGPDGAVYFCDFPDGYTKKARGRIYRAADPALLADPAVREVKTILASGMRDRSPADLATLLSHADSRVRLRAQYELASRADSRDVLAGALKHSSQLARIHALWALGQKARKDSAAAKLILPLLAHADAELRAQAAKTLGDLRFADAEKPLIALLADTSPRVKMHAAIALGRLGSKAAFDSVVALLAANADADSYLRHAAVMALAGMKDGALLERAAASTDRAIRLGALLAMRRLELPQVARFLDDRDPIIVLEAARAIHDGPVDAAMPQLATMAAKQPALNAALAPHFWLRAVNACFRTGEPAPLVAMLKAATAGDRALTDAATFLAEWAAPPARDIVTGNFRPIPPRDASAAAAALGPEIAELLEKSTPTVREHLARAAGRLRLPQAAPFLLKLAEDPTASLPSRVAALDALAATTAPGGSAVAQRLSTDANPNIRQAATALLIATGSEAALPLLATALQKGALPEKQAALAAFGKMEAAAASEILTAQFEQFQSGKLAAELHLDVLEAARARRLPAAAAWSAALPKDDPLAARLSTLHGGNAARGARLFAQNATLSCLQCHRIDGKGSDVGPDLSNIGAEQDRRHLLESLILPAAKIAKGFDLITVTQRGGAVVAGYLKSETPTELVLRSIPDGKDLQIAVADIASRSQPISGMPPGLTDTLKPSELRDLIEYLATRIHGTAAKKP